MALKNSKTGSLPVSEIYNFMTEHFPYFKVSLKAIPQHESRRGPVPTCFSCVQGEGQSFGAVGRW